MIKRPQTIIHAALILAASASLSSAAPETTAKDVLRQHIRVEPDAQAVKAYYTESISPEQAGTDAYWIWLIGKIKEYGEFSWYEKEARATYYGYWIGAVKDQCPATDDVRIGLARLYYELEQDAAKLAQRLDAQFAQHPKPGDWKRVLKWIRAYRNQWDKRTEYIAKIDPRTAGIDAVIGLVRLLHDEFRERQTALDVLVKALKTFPFDTASNDDILRLIELAHGDLSDIASAAGFAAHLHLDSLEPEARLTLARRLRAMDGAIAEPVYTRLNDNGDGLMELYEYYCRNENFDSALKVAGQLTKTERYAQRMAGEYADLLGKAGRHADAAAYLEQTDTPESLFLAAEQYWQAEQPDKAGAVIARVVADHRTPENLYRAAEFHKQHAQLDRAAEILRIVAREYNAEAVKAAYTIACMYSDAEEAASKEIRETRRTIKDQEAKPQRVRHLNEDQLKASRERVEELKPIQQELAKKEIAAWREVADRTMFISKEGKRAREELESVTPAEPTFDIDF